MAVLGIVLLVGLANSPGERQRRAVAKIKSLGGSVAYQYRASSDGTWLSDDELPWPERWLPKDWVYHVKSFALPAGAVTSQEIGELREALPYSQGSPF
jgi:hypothetical protein